MRRYDPAYGALRTVVAESPLAQAGDIEVVGAHWCVYQGRRFGDENLALARELAPVLQTYFARG